MSMENSTTGTATNNKKNPGISISESISIPPPTSAEFEQFLRSYALHEAIQVEKKYQATLHLFNQSQEQPKLECTPDHFLETTHTQQHYERNEAFKKNESINQKSLCLAMKKVSEESSNANYEFHWPDGNISFQFPNSQLMEDGHAYFRYALYPLYSTKATHTQSHSIHYYCLGVDKCYVEGCPFLQQPKQPQRKKMGVHQRKESIAAPSTLTKIWSGLLALETTISKEN